MKTQNYHWVDDDDNASGGVSHGEGFAIVWRNNLKGAGVGDVIECCADRIEHYQKFGFACAENAKALGHLREALAELRKHE
jgi:hypothetical protein